MESDIPRNPAKVSDAGQIKTFTLCNRTLVVGQQRKLAAQSELSLKGCFDVVLKKLLLDLGQR
jgi:hypothetical protein